MFGLGTTLILINKMETITIKNFKIKLELNTVQTSPQGRPFRCSGLRKNLQSPSKWINKTECWQWIYSFKYLDEQGGFFEIEIDYNDKFVKLIKL